METKATMIKFMDCAFQDGSYPCGYKDGGRLPDCELCHKIRKAGIQEVVEWMKPFTVEAPMAGKQLGQFIIRLERPDWRAKLKEWEIGNERAKS